MSQYSHIISSFKGKRIAVIGDVILDQHIQGEVYRISPEAPVPVVLQQGEATFSPGGAANVAQNLRSLGAHVLLVGKIGPDADGKMFLRRLRHGRISTSGIIVDKNVPTIVKTRIMARHQQVLRLDKEKVNAGHDEKFLARVLRFLKKHVNSLDAIIISDYGKGMVCPELIEEIRSLALKKKKILTVDPKVEHFGYYRKVTGITPNKQETENAIRNIKITHSDSRRKLNLNSDRLHNFTDVERAGKQLLKFLDLESLLITLGEDGICLLQKGKKPIHIHTKAKEVFDVTGAGDTVISVYTLALAAGATKFQAADLANHAAGIVVGKMGAVSVTRKELLASTKTH